MSGRPPSNRDFDLLVVGDVNVDIILGGMASLPELGTEELATDLDFRSGGSAANCARAAAKLGARVAFVGLVGEERFGDFLLEAMRESGVSTDYLRRSDLKTGVTVSLSMASDRAFATYLGASAALTMEHVDARALNRARHLHVGGYFLMHGMRGMGATSTPKACKLQKFTRPEAGRVDSARSVEPALSLPKGPRAHLLARAKEAGLTTSLDPGWDPGQQWNGELQAVLEMVDILLPNETEALHLAERGGLAESVAHLAEMVPTLAVKLGAQGALARRGEAELRAPAYAVDVLDTTALGDCFNAGFLVAHLEGRPLGDCLRMGNAAAAIAASRMGDDRYPMRAEVERLMAAPGPRVGGDVR